MPMHASLFGWPAGCLSQLRAFELPACVPTDERSCTRFPLLSFVPLAAQAFRSPADPLPESGGGTGRVEAGGGRREEGAGGRGRKGDKGGERGKGAAPRDKEAPAALVGSSGGGVGGVGSAGGLGTFASVASRVTLSSYHALLRASLRRALELGTWRSHACWQCAGVSAHGRPHALFTVCPDLQPAAAKALDALSAAQKRGVASGVAGWAEWKEASEGVVVAAPPLFGSEAALREHLSHAHFLPRLDGMRDDDWGGIGGLGDLLRRCPKEALPAEPSQQLLDALLGVSGAAATGITASARAALLNSCLPSTPSTLAGSSTRMPSG